MRRLIYAVILLVGVAIALSQFAGVDEIAASLLASGVVAAAIIGFAARQTLANFVAGVMLAITQPIRVGDWVTFEGHYGVVEDVRLNYTILRTAGETRVVIPNERLAVGDPAQRHAGDRRDRRSRSRCGSRRPPTPRARERVLREESGADVTVAEAVPWGVRLAVGGGPVPRAGARRRARRSCAHGATRACARRACWRVSQGRTEAEGLTTLGGSRRRATVPL